MQIQMIKRDLIFSDPEQPRKTFEEDALKRLKESIISKGIIDPLHIRKSNDTYIIIDGERRWRCCAGLLKELPCIITTCEDSLEEQLLTDCLKENLSTEELDQAIFKYYNKYISGGKFSPRNKKDYGYAETGEKIGQEKHRVKDAVERMKFFEKDPEFIEEKTKEAETNTKKENKEKTQKKETKKKKSKSTKQTKAYNKTKKIENKVVQRKVYNTFLEDSEKPKKEQMSSTQKNAIVEQAENIDDIEKVENVIEKITVDYTKDPNFLISKDIDSLGIWYKQFESKDFGSVVKNISPIYLAKVKKIFNKIIDILEPEQKLNKEQING